MADKRSLSREVTSLLEALSREQLFAITHRAVIDWFDGLSRHWLGDGSLEDLLRSMLPDLLESRIPEVMREIAVCTFRNAVWNPILSLPGQQTVRIRCLTQENARALRERKGPAIVVFWHHGATHMVSLGLQAIGVPAVIVGGRPPDNWFRHTVSPESKFVISGDAYQSTIALKTALDRLKKGGAVLLAMDGRSGHRDIEVPFLGRVFTYPRGIAVLARLTGAQIIPALATWSGKDWGIDFRIFDPLPLPSLASAKPDDWERQATTVAGRFFDEMLRTFPGQFRLDRLAQIATLPRV